MKLGLFGGTFDPIHWGHLRSAEEVREALGLDRVLFIPASLPPLKTKIKTAPAADRLKMVRLAIAGNPAFAVSSVELSRPGKSFTIDTLRYFAAQGGGDSLYFILGIDAFLEIGKWKNFAALFALAHFVVTTRPGLPALKRLGDIPVAARKSFCYDSRENVFRHASGTRLHFVRLTDLAIAASDIRARSRSGKSIRYLVPPAVERYIKEKELYR